MLEIERKWLTDPPETALLETATRSDIVQTYLRGDTTGSERVRARTRAGITTLTHTIKRSMGAGINEEVEREIDQAEYDTLLLRRDPGRKTIEKTRYRLEHAGLVLEIDEFHAPVHFWMMEIELPDEELLDADLPLPAGISILSEVTGNKDYSNANIALRGD